MKQVPSSGTTSESPEPKATLREKARSVVRTVKDKTVGAVMGKVRSHFSKTELGKMIDDWSKVGSGIGYSTGNRPNRPPSSRHE